jgi:hypothetical protein
MIDLSNKCIFCDSEQNLNTTMNVKIDDTEYKVSVCTAHEDGASPKAIRQIVQEKAGEIEKIKQMAAKYGLKLEEPPRKTTAQPSGHKLIYPGMKKQEIKAPQPQLQEPPAEPDNQEVPIQEVDQSNTAVVERHDSYSLNSNKSPKVVTSKNQVVKTESGREIVVPSVIFDDNGGKTSIKIVNTGGDKALQSRFKELAEASKGSRGPDFRNQYSVRDCNICGGSGVSRTDKKKTCPKCGGDGMMK